MKKNHKSSNNASVVESKRYLANQLAYGSKLLQIKRKSIWKNNFNYEWLTKTK